MISYRFYHLVDNHIVGAEQVDAPDDAAALRRAALKNEFEAVEVWSGQRQVGIVAAPSIDTALGDGRSGCASPEFPAD